MIHKSLLHIRFFGPRPGDAVLVVSEVGPVFHDFWDDIRRETRAAAKQCREHGSVSPRVGRKAGGGVHGT